MPHFPKLKTGAVMQYPSSREVSFSREQIRFLDGSEQRYRMSASALRRWIIYLELLDEYETEELERFFHECKGMFARFSFTDPSDGAEYTDCSLAQDVFETTASGEMRNAASLVISQNR